MSENGYCLSIESGIARSDENSIRLEMVMNASFEVSVDLETLRSKAEIFQQEESARRERALLFIKKLCDVLCPLANSVLTGNDFQEKTFSIGESLVYFRWIAFECSPKIEMPGFYVKQGKLRGNIWGEPLSLVEGTKFWGAIRTIVDWLPELRSLLDEKDESRERLLALLEV